MKKTAIAIALFSATLTGAAWAKDTFYGYPPSANGSYPPGAQPSVPRGAINTTNGQYYSPAAGGVTDPRTGMFYQDVGGGYINTQTGAFMPKVGQ